jgi:AraC-like DNA-binding protein
MSNYKFENFIDRDFPVYSSIQSGTGQIVNPHYHDEAELILMLSGNADVYIDTVKFECKQNDLIFIPSYCVHHLISNSSDTSIIGVVFNYKLINNNYIFDASLERILNKEHISKFVFDFYSPINSFLSKSIRDINSYYRENPLKKPLIYAEIIKICYFLNAYFNCNKENTSNLTRISPVIDYIKSNYYKNIKLSELSSIIHVCDNHLIRLFKSATNRTPINYINDIRIEQALKLLINSELSITEISYKVGFSSVNYMSNIFKTNLKISPNQYRKRAKA